TMIIKTVTVKNNNPIYLLLISLQQSQRQIEAQQRQIESLQQQKPNPQLQQEDLVQKLKKYGDLKQQGIITEEEFQKLKADLLSKM
ncbi:MAG: SHOCT domain-containing protein, partial [Nitrososphaeraceae archaeon]